MLLLHKRPIMLLETMIAFALVVLCVLPLIAPHVGMLKVQRQFIRKIELDHAVNLFYASVLEQLFLNTIDWNELTQSSFPLSDQELQRLRYEGSYNFIEVEPRFKPRDPHAPYALYLVTLTFNFLPLELKKSSEEIQQKNLLKYRYEIFLVRDLRPENAPEGKKDV